jgi:hypothetical protein
MNLENLRYGLRSGLWIVVLVTAPVCYCWGQPKAGASPEEQATEVSEEVTTEEVKQFLDPTIMINAIEYSFQANFLIKDVELFTHEIRPMIAFTHWTAVWADIPIQHFSIPGVYDPAGIGDVVFGWGVVTHENLRSRFTSSALIFEILAPTGDPSDGTGFGTTVLSPGGGIALNPSKYFPIYITARYLHSLEELRGPTSEELLQGNPDLKVRSIELNLETFHILPKGFFLAVLPSVTFNLNQDFNFFTLGLGVGRALTKHFAIQGGYVNYVAGEKTFNQAITVGFSYIFGTEKVKKERSEPGKRASLPSQQAKEWKWRE